jgi:hypothetical protein
MSQEQCSRPCASSPPTALHAMIGKYLPDLILGANDGIITTLAVVSGVVGAALSSTVILILGFANLVADGFSMGVSNFLSRRSITQSDTLPTIASAARYGVATFVGFVTAGLVPLCLFAAMVRGCSIHSGFGACPDDAFRSGCGPCVLHQTRLVCFGTGDAAIGALAAGVAYGIGALVAAVVGESSQ